MKIVQNHPVLYGLDKDRNFSERLPEGHYIIFHC